MPYVSVSDNPQLYFGHATHAGRSGKNNEDDFGLFDAHYRTDSEGVSDQRVLVAAVADGIGGSVAGERASRLAVEALVAGFSDSHKPVQRRMEDAIRQANAAINRDVQLDPALHGMGTTIVVATIIGGDRLLVAHAGDSRAYLLRGGKLHLLTLDHTWAQEALEAGRLTPDEARTHTNRHVIKNFLGIGDELRIDGEMVDFQRGPLNPVNIAHWPKARVLDFLPGDTLLLCSDGLSDVVDDDKIARLLARHVPQEAADRLVAEANRAGGPDNITAVIVRSVGGKAPVAAGRRPSLVAGISIVAVLALLAAAAFVLLRSPLGGVTVAQGQPATPAPATVATVVDTPARAQAPTAGAVKAATSAPTVAPTEAPTEAPPAVPPTEASIEVVTEVPAATLAATPADEAPEGTADTLAVTVTPQPDASAPPTSTPADTPVAEAVRTVETPTRRPTSTPVQPATATVTVTPEPTATTAPRATPRPPVAGPTPAVAASTHMPVPMQDLGPRALVAVEQSVEQATVGDQVTFSWRADTELAPGQVFELVFAPLGTDPRTGNAWTGATSERSVTVKMAYPGDYQWGVFLATAPPSYRRIHYLGEGKKLHVQGRQNEGSGEGNSQSGDDTN